jgi:hypothetical protein
LKTSGKVTYNGHEMHEFVPQRTAAYISQHDLQLVCRPAVGAVWPPKARVFGVSLRDRCVAEAALKYNSYRGAARASSSCLRSLLLIAVGGAKVCFPPWCRDSRTAGATAMPLSRTRRESSKLLVGNLCSRQPKSGQMALSAPLQGSGLLGFPI